MLKRKNINEKGILGLSQQFKEFENGSKVVLICRLGIKGKKPFPRQFNGKIAEIINKTGNSYTVRFLIGKVHKTLILNPVYLKKFNK